MIPVITQTQHMTNDREGVDVSVVVPLMNEQDSIVALYEEIAAMADAQTLRYEVIFVDDGSRDLTIPRLVEATQDDDRVSIVQFTKNFGQTAAMAAGFAYANGAVIVPMDGDGQNDPADIPRLVAKLDEGEGWDIVSGWRKDRKDKMMSRRLPSIIANRLVKQITWTTEIHDFGCSLKAYRREVLEDVRLYGEMHRFLPAICKWRGARITEEVVHHRARTAGVSKYGLKRTIKVLLDLITVKFMGDYLAKPIYFFGKLAGVFMLIATLSVLMSILNKFGILTEDGNPVNLNRSVFVLFAMMTGLISVMMLMMGVLSELMSRVYHESQDRRPYKVRKVINPDADHGPPPTVGRVSPQKEKAS
ncbi:MAG: glycosyltransferase family 2 protein [Phycisphaerales bacterium JB063]